MVAVALAGAALVSVLCRCGQPEPSWSTDPAGLPFLRELEASDRHTRQDYVEHVAGLRPQLPDGFTMVIEPPFVVVGDGDPADVRWRAEGTVRRYVRLLRQDYFEQDPERVMTIWLFQNSGSLERHHGRIFGDDPASWWGYHSAENNALVVDISTGGGTLAHEMVHPFMAANFPACPAWFDEGLASLYEYPDERDGHIYGHTNWRLPPLQRALEMGLVQSFTYLTSTSVEEFYGAEVGLNYAQARYLCHYLQENDLLRRYYEEFLSEHEEDPTGYQTLIRVLESDDMFQFRERWERHVMALDYPPRT